MSKNSAEKQSFRRYSPGARIAGPRKSLLDKFGAWIGGQSRLVRFVMAAFIAIIMTATLVFVVLGFVMSLSSEGLTTFLIDHPEFFTLLLIILAIFGIGFYWVGWRLLIGFDRGETVLEPGRPAALWVIAGFIALIALIVLAAITVAGAMA
jgi:hypothetical protein